MSKYIKYDECRVNINGENVFALSAELAADSSSMANVLYGGEVESYNSPAQLSAQISMRYYVTGLSDNIASLTGKAPCTGSFGGIDFSGAYLTEYSIGIEPYRPVVFSATFGVYGGYKNTLSTGSFESEGLSLANGAHSTLSNINFSNIGLDNPQQINYSISCERFPDYTIGEEFATSVSLKRIHKNLSIMGENIGSVIDFSGKDFAKVEIQPKTNNNISRGQAISCSGIINSQNISVSKNGLIQGEIELIERVR